MALAGVAWLRSGKCVSKLTESLMWMSSCQWPPTGAQSGQRPETLGPVQKRVNSTGLTALLQAYLQGCVWLAFGNLDFRRVPTLCGPRFLVHIRQRMSTWPTHNKYIEHCKTTFHTCCHSSLLEELSLSCETLLGGGFGGLSLVSSGLTPIQLFHLLAFALCPFTIIQLSHDYNHTLSPVDLIVNHQTWGWSSAPNPVPFHVSLSMGELSHSMVAGFQK